MLSFNPRAREGATWIVFYHPARYVGFNPRAREGATGQLETNRVFNSPFQSTRP